MALGLTGPFRRCPKEPGVPTGALNPSPEASQAV